MTAIVNGTLDGRVLRLAAGMVFWINGYPCHAASLASDLANLPPAVEAVDKAAQHIKSSGCKTRQCHAVSLIDEVFRIDFAALDTTMGVTRPVPADRDAIADRALDHAILDHPERFGPVCESATRLISRYSLPGVPSDTFVPVSLIGLGFEMDRRDKGACLTALLAALPPTTESAEVIASARTYCILGKKHPVASCDAITRRQVGGPETMQTHHPNE